MSARTLIRGGCVLTLGARTPNFVEADVLVEDGRVAEVGPRLRVRDAEVVDATDAIVMPGFVDGHRHAWKTLLRGAGGDASDHGPHHQPDDVYAATLVALLSAAEAGITTVVDHADIQVDDRYAEASLQAHAGAGLRTVLVPSVPAWAAEAADDGAALRRLVAGRPGAADPLTTVAAGPPQPRLADLECTAADWALAREQGLRVHAHVGTDPADRGVVAALARRGLLGADVTLVHCSHLDDADLDAAASSGAAVVLAPSREMAAGLGLPPLQQLIDRGIRPGLAVDDELVAPGDLFAQMRAAQSLQHALVFDRKLAGKADLPSLLNTRDVIRYATVDGARAVGLGDVTGSLEPGKQADLVVLRTDRPNVFPINDPIGAVVWAMDASNVDWVLVGGRALVRNGVLEADAARARDLATAARGRIAAANGLVETGSGGPR